MDRKKFGQYLKKSRVNSKLTQAKVAEKLGYSTPQFVSNFERGLCEPPLENLKKLIGIYKLNTDEVINMKLEMEKKKLKSKLKGFSKKKKNG